MRIRLAGINKMKEREDEDTTGWNELDERERNGEKKKTTDR